MEHEPTLRGSMLDQRLLRYRPLVDVDTGGGTVEAPLVFASRGVSPADYPPVRTSVFAAPDLGTIIANYADDYAGIDVRGKVVLLVRFYGVANDVRRVAGPAVDAAIDNALKRGAAAVLFVDPDLPRYVKIPTSSGTLVNPYLRLETQFPISEPAGRPVIVLSVNAANRLLAPSGIVLSDASGWLEWDGPETAVSRSRDLGVTARIDVPLGRQTAHVASVVGEAPVADARAPRIVVWSVRHENDAHHGADVLAALARQAVARGAPFVFVDFDPTIDANANARQIKDALADRAIKLMVILDGLDGSALRFTTPFGELVPAMDLYAERAGARHVATRATVSVDDWEWPGIGPYVDLRAVLVQSTAGSGDLRPDAAALLGYISGRLALGAEELR